MMKVIKNSGLVSYGDSFTAGFYSNNNNANGYAKLLADHIGGQFLNRGLGNSMSTYSAGLSRQTMPIGYRRPVATWMSGLNDIRMQGASAIPKITHNLRSFLADCFTKDICPASRMVRVGNWINMPSSVPQKAVTVGGNSIYTSGNANASLEWSFWGDNVVVGGYVTNGTTGYYQNLSIEIDGVDCGLFETFGTSNEQLSNGVKIYTGLGEGIHTIKIKATNALQFTTVDYVATIGANENAVIVSEIPYLLNWSQFGSIANKAICDQANNAIKSVVDEFCNFNVIHVDINNFWNPQTQSHSDGLHPVQSGHDAIFEAFKSKIKVI